MNLFHLRAGKPATALAVTLLAAAGLVACGGHHAHDPGTPTVPVIDAYFVAVSAMAASSPDDTEPGPIEAIVATAPEDTEPQPFG